MSDSEKQSQIALSSSDFDVEARRIRDSTATYPSSAPLESIDGHTDESLTSDSSEGGAKAYLTIFGAFLALFCTFGQMNAFGTFQAWYSTHQLHSLDASTISWIGSLQLWVFFFSGGPIGYLFDKYGPRMLMLVGTICYVLSIMITSISTQYYQYILSQGVLFGLGVGLLFYPSLSSVSTHFATYRATATGLAVAGSGLGGVVFPIMLQNLFERVGFGWATRISGLLCGVLCGIAVLTVTTRTSKNKATVQLSGLKCLKEPQYMLLAAGGSLVALGCFVPYFYVVDYAQSLGISSHMAFVVLSLMNAGGVFGRVAPAILSDRIGRFNLLAPTSFVAGFLILVSWMFAHTLPTLIVFSILYGFFSGAFISVITPCVAEISDLREIGMRIGLMYSIISFPALLGGPIAGVILKSSDGSYDGMIVFAGTSTVAGSLLIFGVRFLINPRLLAHV
ncbi:major facilitator superfamily domain-containing protein [Lentinula aciculospora]|uniref:Major facilitator superfamily domain-containing protein n=1 Tax=Lentinula aciculospora TaxID=153920 RepID=A0A9W9AKA2_9AGAR|nr:major facilitator superfamily domain-containing protein [Lentinula aciculospora]